MTSTHKLSLLTLATLASMLALPASAQDGGYFYGGVGGGRAVTSVDAPKVAGTVLGAGQTVDSTTDDKRNAAYKFFGGYQINRHVGAELGYFQMQSYGIKANTTPAGTLDGRFPVQGASLDLVGTLPITDKFSALGRVGVMYGRTRAKFATTGAATVADPTPSDRETNAKLGIGLQYAFTPSMLVRGELERFRVSDTVGNHPQVSMFTVSLVFPFGRSESTRRTAAVEPAYVAPMAAAEPVKEAAAPMVVTPPLVAQAPATLPAPAAQIPVPPQRVSYAAESFFTFDRAELRPEGKAALDTFGSELSGASFDTITVQGHADRIGTTAYNQTLSLERAEAVKAYLVSSARLDPSKITTAGMSESQPVTVPDACKGAVTPEVIACLQPNRRVEIEVVGKR
jgi:OmpA-OmpF porin, OOP family